MRLAIGISVILAIGCSDLEESFRTKDSSVASSFSAEACRDVEIKEGGNSSLYWQEFSINPKPDSASLEIGNKSYDLTYQSYDKWTLGGTALKAGLSSTINLSFSGESLQSQEFKLRQQPIEFTASNNDTTAAYLAAGGEWWHEFTVEPKPETVELKVGSSTYSLDYLYEKWILKNTKIAYGSNVQLSIDGSLSNLFSLVPGEVPFGCQSNIPSEAGEPVTAPGMQNGKHNYGYAFQITPLFFAANQMGKLTDKRLPWRQDTYTDGQYSGGFGDAGDNIMFGKAQYASIAYMCITADFFKDELQALGQLDEMKNQIQHGTDFIAKNHKRANDGRTNSLVGQLSDSATDHKKWLMLEQTTHERPVYIIDQNKRGSDYAGLAAAALGFCSRVFSGDYRADLRERSKSLLEFALNYRGLGENNGNIKTVYRNSNGDEDDIALGALGVYRATGDGAYLNQAQSILDDTYLGPWAGLIDHQEHAVFNLLALWNNDSGRANTLKTYMNNWKNVGSELKKTAGGYIIHDSNNWGSSGSVAPALFNMAIYAKATGDTSWDGHMKSQVDYLLGSNPRNMSYLCGYGPENCSQIHHRGASGGSDHAGGDNNHMLWGALLGGVTENDYDFINSQSNWTGNEPTVGYNAHIQAPLLYLYNKFGGSPLADSDLQKMLDSWSGFNN